MGFLASVHSLFLSVELGTVLNSFCLDFFSLQDLVSLNSRTAGSFVKNKCQEIPCVLDQQVFSSGLSCCRVADCA